MKGRKLGGWSKGGRVCRFFQVTSFKIKKEGGRALGVASCVFDGPSHSADSAQILKLDFKINIKYVSQVRSFGERTICRCAWMENMWNLLNLAKE